LHFSSSYHPEPDGQTEKVNQILEDMLRAFVLEFQGKFKNDLLLVEFSYNNSYKSTIKIALFKLYTNESVEPRRARVTWMRY